MTRWYSYGVWGIGVAMVALAACSPEIHEMHKKPDEWKQLDIEGKRPNGKSPEHKPFGCDSRDLATFTCD